MHNHIYVTTVRVTKVATVGISDYFPVLSRFSTGEYFRAKRLFSFVSTLISSTWFQPKAQGQREKVASRENIR